MYNDFINHFSKQKTKTMFSEEKPIASISDYHEQVVAPELQKMAAFDPDKSLGELKAAFAAQLDLFSTRVEKAEKRIAALEIANESGDSKKNK